MPTSATSPLREPDAGLTLVEMLAALAILAVMAAATMLSLGSLARGASGEAEAHRLATRLQFAADEVLVTSTPMALRWDPAGYQFLSWDANGGGWRRSGESDLGSRHALPGALQLARDDSRDAGPIRIEPDRPETAILRIEAAAGAWRVAFDGLGATVSTAGD
ncbi:MAG: prepilin-type N-terminal cleavage/methylation domain-containing protein [Amaricoccus sp.]